MNQDELDLFNAKYDSLIDQLNDAVCQGYTDIAEMLQRRLNELIAEHNQP